jgi:hypothetical protein
VVCANRDPHESNDNNTVQNPEPYGINHHRHPTR